MLTAWKSFHHFLLVTIWPSWQNTLSLVALVLTAFVFQCIMSQSWCSSVMIKINLFLGIKKEAYWPRPVCLLVCECVCRQAAKRKHPAVVHNDCVCAHMHCSQEKEQPTRRACFPFLNILYCLPKHMKTYKMQNAFKTLLLMMSLLVQNILMKNGTDEYCCI